MTNINLDDLILMLHTEVATAAQSASTQGKFDKLELTSIRVRMGQGSDEDNGELSGINLDAERYPVAESGWLVDVTYNASERANLESWSNNEIYIAPAKVALFFRQKRVDWLSGIGPQLLSVLNQLNLTTIGKFADLPIGRFNVISKSYRSKLRQLQIMARIATTPSPIPLHINLAERFLLDVLRPQFESEIMSTTQYSEEQLKQLQVWSQQLEFALDDRKLDNLRYHTLFAT